MRDGAFHEVNQYPDPAFPVALYRVRQNGMSPAGRGLGDYHWHEELQFTRVTCGSAVVQVGAETYPLAQGEALCIGSGCIHAVTRLSPGGEYVSLNFPPRLLGFFPGSRMEQQDVLPYTAPGALTAVVLRGEAAWQRDVLALLDEVEARFAARRVQGQEYAVAVSLVRIWQLLRGHVAPAAPVPAATRSRQERVQVMLLYLYAHYAQDIRLQDLADCAHLSVGECCRAFQACLNRSPYQFLKEYRLRRSCELRRAGHSVGETAALCGFHQTSNFIRAFRAVYGCTPLQFQRRGPD